MQTPHKPYSHDHPLLMTIEVAHPFTSKTPIRRGRRSLKAARALALLTTTSLCIQGAQSFHPSVLVTGVDTQPITESSSHHPRQKVDPDALDEAPPVVVATAREVPTTAFIALVDVAGARL